LEYLVVEDKFKKGWKTGTAPTIKKVYKVIESKAFLSAYNAYLLVAFLSLKLKDLMGQKQIIQTKSRQ
jgi:hypothetical protein